MTLLSRTKALFHAVITIALAFGVTAARAQLPEKGTTMLGISGGAVSTDEAWSEPGTAQQPPPVEGLPDPMTEFIYGGRLNKEVVEAQGDLMRAFWKKYDVPLTDDVKKAYGVK
jgi:hypothetical protein